MKTLVIVAHPSMETSIINKRWVEELNKYPEKYTVHELYKVYPDEKNIDVEKEQHLIESHGNLILQFPIHNFNCPHLLKKWIDDVFIDGFAFGSNGDKLKNRKAALAVSAGSRKEYYSEKGRYRYTLDQLLAPFETTFLYCGADYRSFFALYGSESEPGENDPSASELNDQTASKLEKSAQDYLNFVDK